MPCSKWLILTKPIKFALSFSHQVVSDSFAIPWTIACQGPPSMELQNYLGSKTTADGDYSHEIKRHLLLGRKVVINLDSILKSRDITLLVISSQGYGFSSSNVWIWELDYKESWAQKTWCFWTVVLEKTLESLLDCKEIQPVHCKRNQSWIFIGRTGVEAETLLLWPPDAKNWLTGKDPDSGKDWRREKGTTGWDGWMVSPTQWTWVWVNSRS